MQISLVKTESQTQPDYHVDIPILIKTIFLLKHFLLLILDTKYQVIQINLLNASF